MCIQQINLTFIKIHPHKNPGICLSKCLSNEHVLYFCQLAAFGAEGVINIRKTTQRHLGETGGDGEGAQVSLLKCWECLHPFESLESNVRIKPLP